jgi:DNA-binding NarL/FixJ family response regulator
MHEQATTIFDDKRKPTYKIVGIVEDGYMLVREAARLLPDVMIGDISMPKLNGLEAGALGYVLKHSAHSELLQAVERVLLGKKFITAKIAQELLNSISIGLWKNWE